MKHHKIYTAQSIDDYAYLSILPNNECNFRCAYCYSSANRTKKTLSFEQIKVVLDYFIDNKRNKEKQCDIVFLGGGEPLLSWDTIKPALFYARQLSEEQGIETCLEIVTNGSILTDDMLKTFVQLNVVPRVSFEILKDVQNKQRGDYAAVSRNLVKMLEAGIHPLVRAMITPLNVERMKEMVQTLIDRFSAINYMLFDPITDSNVFCSEEITQNFCSSFIENFFAAADIATQNGKTLTCAMLQNLKTPVKRYCPGELCLTPEGVLSICHRISSPADKGYENCIYGEITQDGKMQIDSKKFSNIIYSETIDNHSECANCFLKWHCAGGCMVHNSTYPPEIHKVFCHFYRKFATVAIDRQATALETTELSLLLNYKCNFSCAYCYSAKGRSNKSINLQKLKSVLKYFIDRKRTKTKELKIVFSGGGDPLMSADLVKEAIEYSTQLSMQQGFEIKYGIVTNGTMISPEMLALFKQYPINVVVSFDVLPDVHNRQRNRYYEVCNGIDLLVANDIYPDIRCTITPLNVHLMEETVNEMLARFPALGGIALEPVLNRSLFPTAESLKSFYRTFIDHYFKAAKYGEKNNFFAGNSTVHDAFTNRQRACVNKFVVTPEGEITACSRISNSREDYFSEFLYGKISDDGNIVIDNKKRKEIFDKNVNSSSECSACAVRLQCGGGCLLARYSLPADYFHIHCDFMRELISKALDYE